MGRSKTTVAAPRLTLTTRLILGVLLDLQDREVYGLEICKELRRKSGTIYPLLAQLEAHGWVRARQETVNPRHAGRPPRRYYQLTEAGAEQARQVAIARVGYDKGRLDVLTPRADDPWWTWRVEGMRIPTGTIERSFEDEGAVQAESAPDAILRLMHRGPFWGSNLDINQEFSITIGLAEEQED